MEKLNQIIESMALAQFTQDSLGQPNRIDCTIFVLKNATLGEFIDFYQRKKYSTGKSWHNEHHSQRLDDLQGLEKSFVEQVLWPKLKDKYIENVVKGLESRLDAQYKVTIEQI